jgi:hypothetical protein
MAETPRNEWGQGGADLVSAARDRGMEQLEGAKGQLAEGAERVAAAVDRTADELDGEGDSALSGYGHSLASLMRELAGGLRERDVEAFARELGVLARRNPGLFLAGSVALGFGIARFFKAHSPQSFAGSSASSGFGRYADGGRQYAGAWQDSGGRRREFDADESLDLSAGAARDGAMTQQSGSRDYDGNPSESRQSGKPKGKTQRASSGGSPTGAASQSNRSEPASTDPSPTGDSAGGRGGSAFTGGKGGGALRGGKS